MKQKRNIQTTGSFYNWIMSNNESLPKKDEWATICHWSDRDVAKVVEVSHDGKRCKIEDYGTIAALPNSEMGHQDWHHYPTGNIRQLVYRNRAWREEYETIEFTKEWIEYCETQSTWSYSAPLTPEQRDFIYNGQPHPQRVLEGITRKKINYSKISILFGVCNYHYDWTF